MAKIATAWLAVLSPIRVLLTPWRSRIRLSSGVERL